MKVISDNVKVPIKAWVDGVLFEEEAERQLRNLAQMPFIHKHIAVMADCHAGIGATVGSVIATKGAIIPAAVGVDLGCGMIAARLPLKASQLPDNLKIIRSEFERVIPHGRTGFGKNDRGSWCNPPERVAYQWNYVRSGYESIVEKFPKLKGGTDPVHQVGTLGTGNHFVELCIDENQNVWLMLHSGSRGVGNKIGSFFIEKAKEEMSKWFVHLPDKDLAYLPEGSEYFKEYVSAVQWAQEYAAINRYTMLWAAMEVISEQLCIPDLSIQGSAVSCHHNYISHENHFGSNVWVTRKGAVSAQEGQLGIIPGSMGTKSYIVRGKGNAESFHSCSHGAGRKMSRTEAKKRFSVEDHTKATEGVECRKDESVIDETPAAYKDIDAVMAAQSDLVDVVHTLKQVLCVKG